MIFSFITASSYDRVTALVHPIIEEHCEEKHSEGANRPGGSASGQTSFDVQTFNYENIKDTSELKKTEKSGNISIFINRKQKWNGRELFL